MDDRGGANKVVRLDEDKSKYDAGGCDALSRASVKCLEDLGYDKKAAQTACKVHYDAYRECRKQQNEAKRMANGGFWGRSLFFGER